MPENPCNPMCPGLAISEMGASVALGISSQLPLDAPAVHGFASGMKEFKAPLGVPDPFHSRQDTKRVTLTRFERTN